MTLHKQIAIRRHAKCALVDGERLNPAAHLALAAHSQISVLSGTFPMKLPTWAGLTAVLLAIASAHSAIAAERDVFDHDNLVAWCIVPFDSARRGPEERAKMLAELGFRQLAYDWREEHISQWDEEVEAMQRHGVRIVAWWMAPPDLNETNRKILDVVRRHQLKLQFWVSIGDPADPHAPQPEKVRAAAAAIRPLAREAAQLGCRVGLYNHGGWFGEPENQLAILKELTSGGDGQAKLDNIGLVYNLHHGHAHVDRFPALLEQIKPWLLALNLNGMTPRGDQLGKKILPIGTGELDLQLLRTIRDSGYRGPIGILNHTDLDARARLADNLAGLDWLVKQLNSEPAGPFPKMQTYSVESADPAADVRPPKSQSSAETRAACGSDRGRPDRGECQKWSAGVCVSQICLPVVPSHRPTRGSDRTGTDQDWDHCLPRGNCRIAALAEAKGKTGVRCLSDRDRERHGASGLHSQ